MKLQPVNPRLNVAVLHIAGRLFPRGYRITDRNDDAPSIEALREEMARDNTLTVWSGASDDTIYADREVNWAFRAWHDFHHARSGYDFTLAGERLVAEAQARDLFTLYGTGADAVEMAALILAEVIGQAEYFRDYGTFPQGQRDFTVSQAPLFRLHAQRLADAFAASQPRAA
jgi:hypothetical protein